MHGIVATPADWRALAERIGRDGLADKLSVRAAVERLGPPRTAFLDRLLAGDPALARRTPAELWDELKHLPERFDLPRRDRPAQVRRVLSAYARHHGFSGIGPLAEAALAHAADERAGRAAARRQRAEVPAPAAVPQLVDAIWLAQRVGADVGQVLAILRRCGVERDASLTRRLPGRAQRIPAFREERVREIEALLRRELAADRARIEAARREEERRREQQRHERAARAARLRAASGLGDYPALFPEARSLGRRWIAFLGPTNSGKTYAAMQALMTARTGVYLAPLRLLALEGYEILQEGGMKAAMLTGEETLGDLDAATHVASTIEMLSTRRVVDAAVIDEVQMLGDPQRGHAWTQALVGAPARTLLICGSPAAEPALRRLSALLGEPLEIRRFQRKAPLELLSRPVHIGALREGDAVVVFSRRQAHDLRQALGRQGRRTAMIYGSLSPQVRRTEAARFNSGEAEILIATDAIGMGLNLNIRRILFGALKKFTGTTAGWLEPEAMRQIAGRAGRYGKHEVGEVGVLLGVEGFDRLATALRQAPAPLDPPSFRFFPPAEATTAVAEGLGVDRLLPTLDYIAGSVARRGEFVLRLEDEQRELAGLVDLWARRLPLEQRHRLLGSPIPLAIGRVVDFAQSAIEALAQGRERSLEPELEEVHRLHGYGRLQGLEDLARIATLARWLGRRWPGTLDLQLADALAEEADRKIAAALASRPRERQVVGPERHRPAKGKGRGHGKRRLARTGGARERQEAMKRDAGRRHL
ncbi:helicase-related protein [Benzoatithermus flavus]|uniref:Helicase-related protein n=1 Tax=Benzoatithermus flavus TaxID=3108223 RepID=A0ABU8XMC6_9PROT